MSSRALQEPAILHLIFSDLSILELFRAERVCQRWRAIISSDAILQRRLYLRPGPPTTFDADAKINPLLLKEFNLFFNYNRCNYFTWGELNGGPWDRYRYRDSMHPTATWRRMIPFHPPVTRLVVHLSDETQVGEVAWIDFSNESDPKQLVNSSPSHPAWLTFGLIYDLLEAAWFQGRPRYSRCISTHYPTSENASPYRPRPRRPNDFPKDLQQILDPGPGKIVVEILLSCDSGDERQREHDEKLAKRIEAVKKIRKRIFRPCGTRPRNPDERVFKDEFHFADALSFDDLAWDQRRAYCLAPPPPPSAPIEIPHARRALRHDECWLRCLFCLACLGCFGCLGCRR